ncbi:MAG: HEAT repeat domain-containing protein [Pirellulales bacterium]|nr:HEAT repeat domain-containing protein [Pirellulales bacterium]
MPISVTCTHCGANFGVKEKCAGMKGRCPKCNGVVQVPAAAPANSLDTSWLDDVETDAPIERPVPKPVASRPPRPAPAAPVAATAPSQGSIEFRCNKCGAGFKVAASFAGRTAKCQKCGQSLRVPAVSEPRVIAPPAKPVAPSRPQPHFPNPLATSAKKPVLPPAEDDLLSELGEGFGLAAPAQSPAARRDPFASTSLPPAKVKSRRQRRGRIQLTWPEYALLAFFAVGIAIAIASGFLSPIAIVPAILSPYVVGVMCFVQGRPVIGLCCFVCNQFVSFIVGWVTCSEYNMVRFMLGWTLSIFLAVCLFVADMANLDPKFATDRRPLHQASSPVTARTIPTAPSDLLAGWQSLISPPGGFRLKLPHGVIEKEREAVPGSHGVMISERVVSVEDHAGYLVVYSSPGLFANVSPEDVLQQTRKAILEYPGTRLVREHNQPMLGHPGLALGILLGRMFVAHGRLYQLFVECPHGIKPPANAEAFFNSFEFLAPNVSDPGATQPAPSLAHGGDSGSHRLPSETTPAIRNLADGAPPRATKPNRKPKDESEFEEAIRELEAGDVSFSLSQLADMKPNDQRKRVIVAALPYLEHTDQHVRSNAIQLLAKWGSETELPVLIQRLSDSSVFVRHDAIRAVSRFKTAIAAEAVADRLPHEGMQAESALRSMGEVAEPAVMRYLQHSDNFTRAAACEILGDIGTPKCAPELFKLERDSSFHVVSAADEALRKIRFRHKIDSTPPKGAKARSDQP